MLASVYIMNWRRCLCNMNPVCCNAEIVSRWSPSSHITQALVLKKLFATFPHAHQMKYINYLRLTQSVGYFCNISMSILIILSCKNTQIKSDTISWLSHGCNAHSSLGPMVVRNPAVPVWPVSNPSLQSQPLRLYKAVMKLGKRAGR